MRVIILFVLIVLLSRCNTKSSSSSSRFDKIFDSVFKAGEPGGAILIAKNGSVIYEKGFGIEDIRTKKAIDAKTLFNVGSISKTFAAFGILRLANENKLSLDDDLYKYFPDFKNSAIAKKIKIHHLLTHTSGLPDIRRVQEESVFYLTAKDEENWAPIKKTDSLEFEPGEKFNYSNPAFNALALIIEKISGKKWQAYIQETIMKPSGMKTSTITDGPHPQSGVSHGYVFDGKNFVENDYGEEPTFAASGNGGVWSSVEELWKYEQAIQNNIFLDNTSIRMSRTIKMYPNWKDSTPPFIGLCWFITNTSNENMIGHTGSQGGFRADYVWLPEKRIFYVILCNTPKPLNEIRHKVLSVALKDQ
ncbi:MAG TPA: serine hydrolase domain-containing protein [Chitinophagaceae bacterium]|nr:serine hydrolase domain-containing protein [Chitinophagaceae bacterium]